MSTEEIEAWRETASMRDFYVNPKLPVCVRPRCGRSHFMSVVQ